ncbi:hypothetical protein E2320_002663, partial [Naja naja]
GEASGTDNQGQSFRNLQTAEIPGCSHWGLQNPMVLTFPSLPVPIYQQAGAGSLGWMGGTQAVPPTLTTANPVTTHSSKHGRQPLKQSVVSQEYLLVSSEEDQLDYSIEEGEIEELSEEEAEPEKSGFKGLFRPHLFKPLLPKAKSATGLELNTKPPISTRKMGSNEVLFIDPKQEMDVIPSYEVFFNMVQRQLDSPGSCPSTTYFDKHFY